MTIPSEFDAIRPYAPEELPQAFEELMADRQFMRILHSAVPFVPQSLLKWGLRQMMRGCKDNLAVQKRFMYPVLGFVTRKCTKSIKMDAEAISQAERVSGRYTFVSNHRDIVLDSALLSRLMVDNGFPTTVEIAIGDNLLIYPWIRRLVRINKAFVVRRSLGMKEMLESSMLMSRYMHYAIAQKRENIWIAQREGRAKDSSDCTQVSVLKMLAMGGEGSDVVERLKQLNIVPLAISYEYDPCDYLKAQEFQQKRDNPSFKKSRKDDLDNMRTGIFGWKGRVSYRMAPCINTWLDEVRSLPAARQLPEVARRMDREIHCNYTLFPSNYVAADLLEGQRRFARHYTDAERKAFEKYLSERVALVDVLNKNEAFLRERILTMYANPLYNKQKACE